MKILEIQIEDDILRDVEEYAAALRMTPADWVARLVRDNVLTPDELQERGKQDALPCGDA